MEVFHKAGLIGPFGVLDFVFPPFVCGIFWIYFKMQSIVTGCHGKHRGRDADDLTSLSLETVFKEVYQDKNSRSELQNAECPESSRMFRMSVTLCLWSPRFLQSKWLVLNFMVSHGWNLLIQVLFPPKHGTGKMCGILPLEINDWTLVFMTDILISI